MYDEYQKLYLFIAFIFRVGFPSFIIIISIARIMMYCCYIFIINISFVYL